MTEVHKLISTLIAKVDKMKLHSIDFLKDEGL